MLRCSMLVVASLVFLACGDDGDGGSTTSDAAAADAVVSSDAPAGDASPGTDALASDASTSDASPLGPGGPLAIVEIMANPVNITDESGEYIELLNTTDAPFPLQGVSLAYVEWMGPDEPDASAAVYEFSGDDTIPAGGRFTVARSTNPGFTEDGTFANFLMTNDEDETFRLRLYTADWDGSEPPTPDDVLDEVRVLGTVSGNLNRGLSWQLKPEVDATTHTNDDPDNFCLASSGNTPIEYASENFGTPGSANDCTF